MGNYEFWFDSEKKAHRIEDMDAKYIRNCMRQIKKCEGAWWNATPESLTDEELKLKDEVMQKAWYVFHGRKYYSVFEEELKIRGED